MRAYDRGLIYADWMVVDVEASKVLMDLRVWVVLAIAVSFIVPSLDLPFSTLIIFVLIIQMTLSMDGLNLSVRDLRENKRGALVSIALCYILNTLVTLGIGALFIRSYEEIWYGWVMLASMPCAIAVVTAATLMKERIEISVVAVTVTYVAGIALTPLLSYGLIGDAVDPLEILKYILLFIFLPVILSRLLAHLHMRREVKVPVINMMMGVMIFCSVNSNQGTLESDPGMVALVVAAAIGRLLVLNAVMWAVVRKARFTEGAKGTYLVLGVWKNTGLSVSMSMIILSAMPEAVIPCFVSLIIETLWFSLITRERKGRTPSDDTRAVPETESN